MIPKVGFWLDEMSEQYNRDELETHIGMLALAFDLPHEESLPYVRMKNPAELRSFSGDLLTFDYGGVRGGYGPNKIVPVIISGVQKWCAKNPDRLALVWCTFPPIVYRRDFMKSGGSPENLLYYHHSTRDLIEKALRRCYLGETA